MFSLKVSWFLRGWRLLALIAAAWLLHVSAQKNENHSRTPTVEVAEARRFFPQAAQVSFREHEHGGDGVFDAKGRLLGFVLTTSPEADNVIGYAGPNNLLVGLDTAGRILGVDLLASGDTDAHVADVKKAESFWRRFIGWRPTREPAPKVEAIAGSTLTSLGIAEALQKRLAGRVDSLRFPEPLALDEVRAVFPAAQSLTEKPNRPGWLEVKDSHNQLLGFAVRTSPASDYARGHNGPTESWLAVASDGQKLLGLRLRRSYDTDDYVSPVREDESYLRQLTGFTVDEWAKMDFKKAGIEGVSGATETSFAVAEGIRRRFAADAARPADQGILVFKPRDGALLVIIAGALVMTFSRWRGVRLARWIWQAALIGVFGLWCGDLLSLALLAGWSRHGLAWQTAPSLVLLAAIALLVPWATRRQIYCHHLCPHGAAQEWLGRFKKLHISLSPRGLKALRWGPGILLAIAFVISLAWPHFELAALEPFDAWALRGAVAVSGVIALAGLAASLFVPMAYCHYACPTGALLKFVRATGSSDHFGGRDFAALGLLVAGSLFVFGPASLETTPETSVENVELKGAAFGTTWQVKLRDGPADAQKLQPTLAAELERIESSLSHWRSNSATSRFNAARTTQALEMPEELVALAARALEVSRASGGAFDITVAPLVQAWGFGPKDIPAQAPSAEEIARLRSFTGWAKLTANTQLHILQKSAADLQIDLGGILQGYAADRLAGLLQANGCTNYLINVGGELLAKGRWRVSMENPAQPEQPLRVLWLQDGALATSGTYRAQKSDGAKKWSHLIDPATGATAQSETTLASVLHPSCALADAWATALLVRGDQGPALAQANGLAALTVSRNRVFTTAGFPADESR